MPGRFHAHDLALQSLRDSAGRLGVEQIDVALIHWPNPSQGRYVEAWQALVDAQRDGLVATIGVSNFTEAHLARIIDATGVTPALNQVELHPYFPQDDLRAVHARLGILTQAWSPLGKRPTPFDEPAVADAAEAHGVTPGQVVLRWHLQLGSMPVPKSADPPVSAPTSTSTASSSPTTRWRRSPPSAAATAAGSTATPTCTRRCSPRGSAATSRPGGAAVRRSRAAGSCASAPARARPSGTRPDQPRTRRRRGGVAGPAQQGRVPQTPARARPRHTTRTDRRPDQRAAADQPTGQDQRTRQSSGTSVASRQERTRRTRWSTTWSVATSSRSPVRRSLTSTVPSASPRPTTTIVGTPISSASLNFTPGLILPARSS